MGKRYSRVFTSETKLYAPGFPIIIEAGALLKDNDTNRILVQLKLINITDQIITAVRLRVTGMDSFGNKVENQDFQMLDLAVKRDEFFGQKIPLVLENNTVRSFTTQLLEVVYSDGTNTVLPETKLSPLGEAETLTEHLAKKELVQQYRIDNKGNDCCYVPTKQSDLWFCTCGKYNHENELSCHACKRDMEQTLRTLDKNTLITEATKRAKNELYQNAMKLYAKNDLDSVMHAQKIFERLKTFKDSTEMFEKCNNNIEQLEKEAIVAAKERCTRAKKLKIITASLVSVCLIGVLLTIYVIIPKVKESQYRHTTELLNVGDSIFFGHYEVPLNDMPEIEWTVLEKNENSILLISTYILAHKKYNNTPTLWELSELHNWLNDTFYSQAFDKFEKTKVKETEEAFNTHDKIFLLDKDEVEKYMPSAQDRICHYEWWLRPYYSGCEYITNNGDYASLLSSDISDKEYGVRPAIWLRIG